MASSRTQGGEVQEMFPQNDPVHEAIPEPARTYLIQAIESRHAPAGCVMLCSSTVEAMLKSKNYTEGILRDRIDKAARDHMITSEMALWAHDIRLAANNPRHADKVEPLPTEEEARKCVDFALALAEYLFVLPSRVSRGRGEPRGEKSVA